MGQEMVLDKTATQTGSIDVLFVTNQIHLPLQIIDWLDCQQLQWAKVDIEQFSSGSVSADIVGTAVVDTTEVTSTQRENFLAVLTKYDRASIGSVLLNDEICFPFEQFKLAALLQSASIDEIIGRLQTNLAYKRKDSSAQRRPADTELSDDTAEQLKMAGAVQRNFLPDELPNSEKLNFSVIFRPAQWVSGDIYDVTRLDETHVGFYIADAVGHSMPAALLTMFLKQAIVMRQTTGDSYRIFEPAEVIAALNKKMAQQHLTGCLFATCCYCLLDTETMKLSCARAGHPYPLIIRKGSLPTQLEIHGGLLGVFEDAQFGQETIQLEAGDKVMLYSDGAEPVIGGCNEQGEFVFTDDFNAIAHHDAHSKAAAFNQLVEDKNFTPAEFDDVTALWLEIRGT
jgi:serine phosphatase RsbU (regulator of sigma subunit)